MKMTPRTQRLVRRALRMFLVAAVLWVIGCAVIYAQMRKPPDRFGTFMKRVPGAPVFLAFPFESLWMRARSGKVAVGDKAPDFALQTVEKSQTVQLSEINRKQPVVLIFGSYT